MIKHFPSVWRLPCTSVCVLFLVLGLAACGAKGPVRPTVPALADQYLMMQGREALGKKRWIEAREYFREVVENYPGSPLRPDAKLAIGDAYLGEGTTESLVLAANEYREFLTFYPNNSRTDYAQYSIAMTFFKQMRAPARDQTPTRETLAELDTFFQRYPTSPMAAEAKAKWRIARDRLSAASYEVGVSYYKRKWYPGAIDRFREVLRDDPGFSRIDAVYYHLAESFARTDIKGEAVPLFDRVVKDYPTSEYHEKAQKRLLELTAQ